MLPRAPWVIFIFAVTARCGQTRSDQMTSGTLIDEVPWRNGLCKNEIQTLQPDFQAERFFSGIWYQEQSMGAMFTHITTKCLSVEGTYVGNNTFNLTLLEYVPLIFSRVIQKVQIKLEDFKKPTFNLTVPFIGMVVVNMPVSILSTDYDNYALVYSCTPSPLGLEGYISEMVFVLQRRRGDNSKALHIREQAWSNGIKYEDFNVQGSGDCPS